MPPLKFDFNFKVHKLSHSTITVQRRVRTSTYQTFITNPLNAKHLLFVTLDILEGKAASHVPHFYCSVIRSRSENVRNFTESDTTNPFSMWFESNGRSWCFSSIPKSDLTIFMCRQNLLPIHIQRNNYRISCQDSISSFEMCYICNSYLMAARCWNDLLIIQPANTFNCSIMNSLGR